MTIVKYILLFFTIGLFVPSSGVAADDSWNVEVTPFFWGIAFNGTSSVGRLPALDVDMSASDMLDNFNMGVAVFAVAQKGKMSLLSEFTYLSLGTEDDILLGSVSQNLDTYLAMAAAAYRLPFPLTTDIYGGLRFVRMDISSELNGREAIAGDRDWIDPIVGVHLALPFSESLSFNLHADVGGFGVGSDLTYMIMPALKYQFTDTFSGKMAWRWLDIDYDNDAFAMDMLISGPMLGVAFSW
jgi:hypothetical protein